MCERVLIALICVATAAAGGCSYDKTADTAQRDERAQRDIEPGVFSDEDLRAALRALSPARGKVFLKEDLPSERHVYENIATVFRGDERPLKCDLIVEATTGWEYGVPVVCNAGQPLNIIWTPVEPPKFLLDKSNVHVDWTDHAPKLDINPNLQLEITHPGDRGMETIYMVVSRKVKLSTTCPSGRDAMIGIATEYSFLLMGVLLAAENGAGVVSRVSHP